jgi:hypothetical protein
MMRNGKVWLLGGLAVTLALGTGSAAPAGKLIEKYTVIPVVLDDTVSSKTAKVGDRFEGHCTGPDCGGFPKNTTFQGVITIAQAAQPGQGGMLGAKIVAAVLPDGTKVNIEAVPSTKDGVKIVSVSGTVAKKGQGKKGGITGAVLGGLIGGDLEGAVVGGAVGAAAGNLTKGKTTDVERKAGHKGYIMMTKPVTLPASASSY